MKKVTLIGILLLSILVSCSKDEIEDVEEIEEVESMPTFPETGQYGSNLLNKDVTSIIQGQDFSLCAKLPTPDTLTIKLTLWSRFPNYYITYLNESGWEVEYLDNMPQYSATCLLSTTQFAADAKIMFYTNDITAVVDIEYYWKGYMFDKKIIKW